MRVPLARLCAITDRALSGGLSHDRIVEELLRGGARWIQLREKVLPAGLFLRDAQAAASRARAAGGLLIVNDRVDLALAARAAGVHVGRDDLPAQEARRLMGPDALIGVSTHSVEEGIAASALPVDYIAIGPVFPTSTKPGTQPVVGLDAVHRLAGAVGLPVVAIGGIGPGNARRVLDAGASAVAMVSALYSPNSIEKNVADLLARL